MIGVVFPGQGSQTPNMGRELVEVFPAACAIFDEVSAAVGRDLRALCWETDEDTLRQTQNAQIALYTCGLAAWATIRDDMPAPGAMAGHSVGEFAALAAAEVMSVADGARLVARRGELMASAGRVRPGGMAAILGLERESLEQVCRESSTEEEVVVIANDNCPGQLVISGDVAAVGRASEAAKVAGAKMAVALNVSGAFHSPLMTDSARSFAEDLAAVEFRAAKIPVFSNVTATAPSGAPWAELLRQQLESPVRWSETMEAWVAAGVAALVECGPGSVLAGLMRRIDRQVPAYSVADPTTRAKALIALAEG